MGLGSYFDYPDSSEPSSGATDPFLAGCTADDWQLLLEHTDTQRFPAEHLVVAEGNVERSLLLVARGQLEVVADARRGRGRRVALLEPGSVIGELGFLDGHPASANVWSLSEVELLRLPLARFEVLAASHPQLALFVLFDLGRVLAERLRNLQRQNQ